uniref:Uncharacterized protein n=1 Tax=Arundo donax TaxID=35708 RepID=A0A0A9ERL6_ARUDO
MCNIRLGPWAQVLTEGMFQDSNQAFSIILSAIMAHNPRIQILFTVNTNEGGSPQQAIQHHETIKQNNIFTFPLFSEIAT